MNLFNKFKDKTIYVMLSDKSTYKGVILSQEDNFIEFKTDSYIFLFNIAHIMRIHESK